MLLQICNQCKSLAADPGLAFCDYCGQSLTRQALEERDFVPLLLVAGIRPDLYLGRNAACRLFFRNFDLGEVGDLKLRLESRTAREAWEKTLPPIPRGMTPEQVAVAEFMPREAGDMVLVFTLNFTDCRGARRRYEGELTMNIQDPGSGSQQAHITFNVTGSKLMGNDLSDLVRMQGASREELGSQGPEGFRRIPIPLHLVAFTPGQTGAGPAEAALARDFAGAGGRWRLAFEAGEPGRRILILTHPSVALGMKKFTTTPQVDLTLRLLPCRSEALDPENWQKTRGISSPHATIQARQDHFVIRDEPKSKNGVFLAALKGGEVSPLPSVAEGGRLFAARAGDAMPAQRDAPEACSALRPLPKGEWEPLPERCEIHLGRNLLQLRAQTFRSAEDELYALLLQRENNATALEYIIAVRRLYVGSGPKCPIRVHDPGFPAIAAALEWNGAQWAVVGGVDRPEVRVDGQVVGRGQVRPLSRACRIGIGSYQWSFDAAVIEDFTQY